MSTGNVPNSKVVNKVLERVKGQDQRNNTPVTAAQWPAQGGLFGRVNRPAPDDQEPAADAPAAIVNRR
ncbi:Uncharacterised protein [Legionella donaldsonii]|uniref:Uncharacterized protein n=1 Tax=Legionella donaldsonii TaxID=45060 RepID=A0A378J2P0_9GAMM|nr:Uncharacterised protein [Legionella donaldsonii]